MTDARLRSSWLGLMLFDDLSDAAWRVFTGGLMWSAEQGTDGFIPRRYVRTLHPDGENPEAVAEIAAAGLWEVTDAGVQFADWDGELGQSTAAQVEEYRRKGRERARRFREAAKRRREAGSSEQASQPATADSATRDVTRDVTANVGIGKGIGKGKAQEESDGGSWPVRPIPDGDGWVESEPGVWAERA